jgi:hypothetical protein
MELVVLNKKVIIMTEIEKNNKISHNKYREIQAPIVSAIINHFQEIS